MLLSLFESRHVRDKDNAEIKSLRNRFGEQARAIVSERAKSALSPRDRKHWQRIARKI